MEEKVTVVRGEVAWPREVMAKEGGEKSDDKGQRERWSERKDRWKGGRGEARGREEVHTQKTLHAVIDYGARVCVCVCMPVHVCGCV